MKKLVLIALLILGGLTRPEQVFPQGMLNADTLTMNAAIVIALEHKADIKIAREQTAMAEARERSALGAYMPRVSASASGSRTKQGERESFLGGVTLNATADTREQYNARLSLNQTVFDGLRMFKNHNVAQLETEQANVNYRNTEQEIILNVATGYIDLLRARELMKVYEKTLESTQAQLELVQERFNLGAVAQTDVFKAQTRVGNDRINYLQQQNQVDLRKRNLNVAMGRNPAIQFAVPATGYTQPTIPDVATAKAKAVQENADLQSLALEREISTINLSIAKSNRLPTIGGQFSYDRGGLQFDDLYRDVDKNWSYSFGLNISIPIFNDYSGGLRTSSLIQHRRAEMSVAEKRYIDAKLQVEMQVANLIQQLETYGRIIELNELNLRSSEEDLRMARERYNLGQATLLDVLDAQAALTNSRRILVYARYDSRSVELQLEDVMGNLNIQTVQE